MQKASRGARAALSPQWKEQVLIDLSRQFVIGFGVAKDEDAAFEWLADDVEWIGPFSWQAAEGIDAIRQVFSPYSKVRESISDERWSAKRVEGAWVVTARFLNRIDVPDPPDTLQFRQRITFVWGRQPEGPRITYLHFSHAVDGASGVPLLDQGDDMLRLLRERFGEARYRVSKLEFRDVSGRVHFLGEEEVLCVLAEGPHCVVKTVWGEFVVRGSLQGVEARLSDAFSRTHRSCLVNVGHVVRVDGGTLFLDDGSACPLAARRRQAVCARMAALAR